MSLSSHVHRDPLAEAHLHRFRETGGRDGTLPEWMTRFHGEQGDGCRRLLVRDLAGYLRRRLGYRAGPVGDFADRCSRCTAPRTHTGSPEQLENIARAVPHADARLLPGIDHFPHLEDPAATDAAIAAFLSDALGL